MSPSSLVVTTQIPYVVERLAPLQREVVLDHLLALDERGRALRFGIASDADAVRRYIDSIDFEHSPVLGARTPDGRWLGIAHLAIDGGTAELGISVAEAARRLGIGAALATAALREAERAGAREFRFDYATDNAGMAKLARRLGMRVNRDGSEFIARRPLRPGVASLTFGAELPAPLKEIQRRLRS
jgi:RimJ/RimL family protein N-acetyltransferase